MASTSASSYAVSIAATTGSKEQFKIIEAVVVDPAKRRVDELGRSVAGGERVGHDAHVGSSSSSSSCADRASSGSADVSKASKAAYVTLFFSFFFFFF